MTKKLIPLANLPESQRVFCVQVVTAFLKAAIPLSKLHHFRDLLEQNAYRVADDRGMYDTIPLVLSGERKKLNEELSGKNVSVVFNGTSRLGEALVIILRFVSDEWAL